MALVNCQIEPSHNPSTLSILQLTQHYHTSTIVAKQQYNIDDKLPGEFHPLTSVIKLLRNKHDGNAAVLFFRRQTSALPNGG